MQLEIISKKDTINAKQLYDELKITTPFSIWIGRRIKKYGFIEKIDFITILLKSTGGRPEKEYHISYGMAKELCMLDESKRGRAVRLKYIELENNLRKHNIVRLAGIEARKTLTDKIKESGENERMHGFAYSSYTKLVYSLTGIEYDKKSKDFRSSLTAEQLERVETTEKMIDCLLALGKVYSEIKDTLSKIIKGIE